ncbi:MAG TPA: chaplin, partial [Streptomyces sp.]|nr:chaplin [Streptomyces sp.]
GNTVNFAGLLNPAFGNICVNHSGDHHHGHLKKGHKNHKKGHGKEHRNHKHKGHSKDHKAGDKRH